MYICNVHVHMQCTCVYTCTCTCMYPVQCTAYISNFKCTVNLAKGSLRYMYLHVTIAKAPNVYYTRIIKNIFNKK